MVRSFCSPLPVLLVLLSACGGGGAAEGAATPGPGDEAGGVPASELPYEPCPAETTVGQFVIELAPGFTRVGGKVSDAVLPSQVPAEVASEGECRLVQEVVTTCTPGCPAATEVCDGSGQCVALPRARDLGTVTVRGMAVPLTMSANAVTRGYSNPGVPALPNPGFMPGADLRLATSGGEYEPFELRGWGVSVLAMSGTVKVVEGSALGLTWQAPEAAGPARLHVDLNINHHGSSTAWIECDFADTGSAEIPASLIDGLIAQGLSGYPTLTATRRTATSRVIEPGCVELLVVSEVPSEILVDGIVSCNVSSTCPEGQSCLPVERYCSAVVP